MTVLLVLLEAAVSNNCNAECGRYPQKETVQELRGRETAGTNNRGGIYWVTDPAVHSRNLFPFWNFTSDF